MATRVFELARELGVTSKDILTKCRAEGLEIKNHMAALSAGLEATVREWFSEKASGTAIETTEHVDLEKVREKARKKRRKKKTSKAKEEPAADEQQPEEGQEPAEAETATAVAEKEGEQPQATTDTAEQPETQAAEPPAETDEQEPAAGEPEPDQPAEEQPAPDKPRAVPIPDEQSGKSAEEKIKVAAEGGKQPEGQAETDEQPETEEQEEPDEDVKPAGPRVVPKPAQLKGPRVVRMEKPEFVRRPPRARPKPAASAGPAPQTGAPSRRGGRGGRGGGPDESDRKTRRRSPRRRGGRRGDSGEKLREWRNQDLLERQQRLAAAGAGVRRHRPNVSSRRKGGGPQIKTGKVEIEEPITIKDLSAATGIKSAEIIKKLMQQGTLATVNQIIDTSIAEEMMTEYDIELVVAVQKSAEDELLEKFENREKGETISRAPVATFLGHVDHGKTSLLDYIRKTRVAKGEAGGITQHIGSYRYDRGDSHVVFLDTPGHEAFTAMRARGAHMTDVVVLVVAADDGVMPQTIEAINHAKAAEVPIIVALNKIDVPNANVNRALGQLAEHDLQPQEWGGNTEVIRTSAETGEGIDTLVETLSLEAELLELEAEVDAPANGYVIEGEMDPGRGAVARLLVLSGTLNVGDPVLAGSSHGRVRQILDDTGQPIEEAGPSTPVEILGIDSVPEAGDRFFVCKDIDEARSVAEDRQDQARAKSLATAPGRSLESLLGQIEEGQTTQVNLIMKVDVQGSAEALVGSLEKLNTDEVKVNVLHTGVGGVNTGDITLAEASDAIIIGFNVVADANARRMAEQAGVEIRLYRVIYDVVEDIRKVLEEGLAPEVREETLGRAEVRQTFKVSRIGTIAGCFVVDGVANRNAMVRITRDNIVIEDGRQLDSLKRFKDDVREVRSGMECGLKIAGYNDVKEGDVLEFYQKVEVARTL